jgi:hypothetical protein
LSSMASVRIALSFKRFLVAFDFLSDSLLPSTLLKSPRLSDDADG